MMVDVRVLTQHLCEQDGADPIQRRKDILDLVREIDRERREKLEARAAERKAMAAMTNRKPILKIEKAIGT